MALKRTIHGEKLQKRETFCGLHAKDRFQARDVYCSHCGAKPNRKCQWTQQDLVGDFCIYTRKWWGPTREEADREARRRNRGGHYDHDERRRRAEHLTALARQSGSRREIPLNELPLVGADPAPARAAPTYSRESKTAPLYRLAVKTEFTQQRRVLNTFDHLPLFGTDASSGEPEPTPE